MQRKLKCNHHTERAQNAAGKVETGASSITVHASNVFANGGGEDTKKQQEDSISGEIVDIAEDISVTTHVNRRLQKRAEREVGFRGAEILLSGGAVGVLVAGTKLYCHFLDDSPEGVLSSVILLVGSVIACVTGCLLGHVRGRLVEKRIIELARARKDAFEQRRLFYGSSEWRLLRQQVIAEQGRRCQVCGQYITDEFNLTVDHIKPRSKFPELALDRANLQVLCRQCNSAKGNTVPDSSEEVLDRSEEVSRQY